MLRVGAGSFTPGELQTWTATIRRAALSDLDGDGHADLAFTDDSSRAVIFRGAGDGTFVFEKVIELGTALFDIIAVDLNGSEPSELIVSQPDAGAVTSIMWTTDRLDFRLVTSSIAPPANQPRWLATGPRGTSRPTNLQRRLQRVETSAGEARELEDELGGRPVLAFEQLREAVSKEGQARAAAISSMPQDGMDAARRGGLPRLAFSLSA